MCMMCASMIVIIIIIMVSQEMRLVKLASPLSHPPTTNKQLSVIISENKPPIDQ